MTSSLDNPRHELLALALARGMPPAAAYEYAFGKKIDPNDPALDDLCIPLRVRVAELQRDEDTSVLVPLLSAHERRAFLARVVRTPLGEVDETSPLVQRMERTRDGRVKLWMMDKRACLALDARLENDAEKRKNTAAAAPASAPYAPLQGSVLTPEKHMQLIAERRAEILNSATNTPNGQAPSRTNNHG